MSMATLFDKLETYFYNLLTIKSHDPLIKWSLDKLNHYISTNRMPLVTKLGSMVTFLDGPLPKKSHHI